MENQPSKNPLPQKFSIFSCPECGYADDAAVMDPACPECLLFGKTVRMHLLTADTPEELAIAYFKRNKTTER